MQAKKGQSIGKAGAGEAEHSEADFRNYLLYMRIAEDIRRQGTEINQKAHSKGDETDYIDYRSMAFNILSAAKALKEIPPIDMPVGLTVQGHLRYALELAVTSMSKAEQRFVNTPESRLEGRRLLYFQMLVEARRKGLLNELIESSKGHEAELFLRKGIADLEKARRR